MIVNTTHIIEDNGEDNPNESQTLHIQGYEWGLLIRPEGFGDNYSKGGHGYPIMIEKRDGELRLIVWGDINQQDPTHIICLDGAKETARQ